MYQLTYDSKILFDPYMQSTAITDAKYTGKSNSVSYLDFTIAPNHPLYNTIEKDKGLVEFYSDNVLKFRGKINEIEIDDYGYKIVACNSVLQYLNHTRVRNYSTVPGDADLTAPTSVEGYFQWLIDQHNLHVKNPSERFEVGVNQGAVLDKNDYILRSNDGYPTTLDEINDKILDELGGYLFVEYKDDRNILNLYADVHSTNSQIIDFGSNILSISYKENDDDLYTVVIPRGGTPEKKDGDTEDPKPINIKGLPDNTFDTDSDIVKSDDCVYSLSATKRYGYREYYYSNNDILEPSNLLKAAVLQLKLQMAPKVTIDTKAIDLSIAYPGYQQLNIGDACRVRSARHNLDDYFMLSEMELDLNDPSQTTYTFGDEYVSLVGRQSNYLKQINSSIDRNYEDVNTAMSYGKAAAKLADEANKTADAANNTAVKASDKAQKATEDAFNANTTANTAKDTANTAKNTADKAQSTATEASKTATAAKATADSANKAAEDLKKKTAEIDKQVDAAQKAADSAAADAANAAANADKVRSDLQAEVDANKKAADSAIAAIDAKADKAQSDLETATAQLETSISTVDKKADKVRSDLTQQVQNVKSEMDTAVDAAQTSANKAQSAADAAQKAADKANASAADLDKSIQAVDAKAVAAKQAAAEAQSKAENVASDLDSANAVIEQHTTELGTLTTKVSNAVTKADSALSVSTEAKQTATEASTTASSAYKDSQTALTQSTTATQTATAAKTTAESASKTANDSLKQSSSAVQTANQISTTLKTEYQTKADADKIYATQSSLKQTSDSITASVSKTYATKDALTALQNVADNAIESWRGTGVPTLTNKPASDWTTDAEKKKHSGDLYYDKATGKAYRFGSDDGKTYTWELNQDSDVTKALSDASKAQTSANNAQTTANAANSAAGKAQTTANTAVSNAATAKNAADAAQSSANKAQGDVDKLKVDIPATYATKSSLTQTAESITANVEAVKTTANSAVTAASKAQQTADGISVNLSKNYQTKSQADAVYATQANLKATSESISAEVTKAQGTADGAVTAASKAQQTADAVSLNLSKNYQTKAQNDAVYATQTSLKATSDSLSASITANAKTAKSAVDKATNLEANLNGFKTTVSQTYTTKTEFANLSIGGTNRVVLTGVKPGRIDAGGNVSFDAAKNDHCYTVAVAAEPNAKYTISGSIVTPENGYISLAFYDQNEKFLTRPMSAWSSKTAPWSLTVTSPAGAAKMRISFPVVYKGKIKLEKGTKATDWSPAPEDLQPAGDYATNSSLTQTANSIKAQVTEVSKTATGAMNKATSVEQTANGLSTKITEQAKTLAATTTTANEAKSTADSNKQTISQVKTTADGAVSRVSSLEQNLDGFKTTVSKTYQTKDGMSAYATTSALKQTSDSITAQVSKVSETATGALNKATSVEQTAEGLSSKITAQGKTLDATTKTANEAKSTADSNKQTISQVKTTADGAVNRVSSLEQNLSGFKQTVSETYTTKSDFNKLSIGSRNFLLHTKDWSSNWNGTHTDDGTYLGFKVRKSTTVDDFASQIVGDRFFEPDTDYVLSFYARAEKNRTIICYWYPQYNASDTYTNLNKQVSITTQWKRYSVQWHTAVRQSNSAILFRVANASSTGWAEICGVKLEKGTKPTDWSPAPEDLQPAGDYATNSSLTQTANSIKAQVTEVSKTATGAMNKATSVEQTANGLSTKITEQGKKLDTTVTTANQAKATADSNKQTISQTANLLNAALAGENMITDGGFESTEWWKGLQTPFRLSNGALYHGAHVLVGDAATGDNRCPLTHAKGQAGTSTSITVTKGRTYRLSGYYAWFGSVPSDFNPSGDKLRLAKPDGTFIAEAQSTKTTAWSYTFVDWKCPADGSITSVRIEIMHQAKGTILWDDVAFRDITEATETSNRVSSVEQNLSGFKTTVSNTYQTKAGMSNYATTSQLTQTATNIKSEVSQTYTTKTYTENLKKLTELTYTLTGTAGKVKWVKLGTLVSNGDASSVLIHVYTGNGYNGLADQNSEFEIFIKDAWQNAASATNAFGVAVTKVRLADDVKVKVLASNSNTCDVWAYFPWTHWLGHYTIQGNYKSWTNHKSGEESDTEPTSGTAQNLAYDSLSTKSYVDQKSNEIALGVVKNYKGPDGSGLATKSDITASEKSITSTVSSTYQTKGDMKNYVTQSQIEQTNNKVTIAFQNSQAVGGTNLLLGTSTPTIVTGKEAANQCVAYYSLAAGSLKNLPVGMYHLQFKIKSDTAGGTAYAQWNTSPWGIGGNKVNIGTTVQTYSVDYYITNNNYPDAKQLGVRMDNAKGNVTISEMKLERGNSMTPWSAAPEDTINDLTNTVQNQASDIANKVSNDDYTGYVNATNKNLSDIQDSQKHLSDAVDNEIKLRESYIQFGQDESNPYMDMGNTSSPNKMRLTNTKLSFTSNNVEVASVSNDKMRISNAEVLQSLRIGNFVWQPRSDGHMALKYSPEV